MQARPLRLRILTPASSISASMPTPASSAAAGRDPGWWVGRPTGRRPVDLGSPKLFFESSHVLPLLSNFERLFLDHGIVGPLGELLGLSGLSSVFLGLARRHRASFPTNGNPARGAKRGFAQTHESTQRGLNGSWVQPINTGGGWRVPRVKSVLPVPVDGRWRQRSPTGSNRTR